MKPANDLFDISGRTAVVTGATRGLGRAIAEGLAARGANVVVSSRKQDQCEEVAAMITDTGGRAIGVSWHAGDWEGAPALIDAAVAEFGRLDIVVNNAGINPGATLLVDMTAELWDKVMQVNLRGPLRLSSVAAPVMAATGGGSIVNISTLGAYRSGAGISHYSASKSALLRLTQSMAAEWAPLGIRANAISPGPFLTDMTRGGEHFSPGFLDSAANGTMQKRVADPSEIVGAVIYFASDASSFVTGEDHVVSGGMLR